MSLVRVIKAEAQRLGFQLVGITSPDPPSHVAVFEEWLRVGRQGEMHYLATERSLQRRREPRFILPDCSSILVLGMRYPSANSIPPLPGLGGETSAYAGYIASYAWGDDYHTLLPERLRALVMFIETQVGRQVPNRWYTDTGPVLERDLAQRAGLGWIGKNTCLIHPRMGSYILLAEIFLSLELETDPPFLSDRCGSCTRCLEACPTHCILPDRTLDARRCISYLTIELKGAVPEQLRHQVGPWVFGCDICQQVCPWNQRFASPGDSPAFSARPELQKLDLTREIALTQAEFSRKFKDSPVKRAKWRGYLRNVAIALGNSASESKDLIALTAVARLLRQDSEALVRMHAAWALGVIGAPEARQFLEEAWNNEADEIVRDEIHRALARV